MSILLCMSKMYFLFPRKSTKMRHMKGHKRIFSNTSCVPYVPTNQLLTMPIIIHVNSSLLYSERNAVYFYAHGDCFIITIIVLHDVQFSFYQFLISSRAKYTPKYIIVMNTKNYLYTYSFCI